MKFSCVMPKKKKEETQCRSVRFPVKVLQSVADESAATRMPQNNIIVLAVENRRKMRAVK